MVKITEQEIKRRLRELKELLKLKPSSRENWIEYCELLEYLDVPGEEIVNAYEEAYSACCGDSGLRTLLAMAHCEFGCLNRAIELVANSELAEDHLVLADGYLRNEKPEAAVQAARHAVAKEPEFDEAHKLLGKSLQACGRLKDALESLITSTEIDPNCGANWQALGECYLEIGNHEEAFKALKRAVSLPEWNGWTQLWYAQACWNTERLEEAELAFRQGLEDFTEFPRANEWFADFLESQGRVREASEQRQLAALKRIDFPHK